MVDTSTSSTRALRAERCTAYHLGVFGYRRIELREIVTHVAPFAQHKAALHVTWTEKGKRKPHGFVESSRGGIGLVVLAGYGHPEPYNVFTAPKVEAHGNGITVRTSMTRWASFDPAWAHEFDRQMRDYLTNAGSGVLADYRSFDANRAERIEALRARGGAGPFDTGDRVVTPSGAGVVMYRRMDPATDHREPAVYSVKIDGHDHAGAIVPAADVRWEGTTP